MVTKVTPWTTESESIAIVLPKEINEKKVKVRIHCKPDLTRNRTTESEQSL